MCRILDSRPAPGVPSRPFFAARVKGIVFRMNWQFWLHNRPLPPADPLENCAHVRPLLSLMSDGMASAKEAKEAQAHLQACADCRQALLWIEATRQAIALRPVVLPPADMRARIARAIAASAETAVPAVPVAMPAARRTFAVRPAYAAAASVAVAGAFLGHFLLTAGSPVSAPPVPTASSGQPQTNYSADSKLGDHTPRTRKSPQVVAAVPPGNAGQANPAHGLPMPLSHSGEAPSVLRPNPSHSPAARLAAALPSPSAPRAAEVKTRAAQLDANAPPALALAPAAGPRHSAFIAVRPAPQPLLGTKAHAGGLKPLVAFVPPAPAAHSPALAIEGPHAPAAVPATQMARLPEPSPAPARAVPGDALGSIRTSLASYRSEGYARRLSMASGVHMRQGYVLAPIAYTPTSLSDTTAAPRRVAVALRSITAQAAPRTAAVTQASPGTAAAAPELALTSSNQRRSERDKQWSDAPANGGA